MRLLLIYICSSSIVAAFVGPGVVRRTHRRDARIRPKFPATKGDGESNDPAAADAIGGDLVTALARLDEKWELAKQSGGGKKIGDWNVLNLAEDGEGAPEIVYLFEPKSGAAPSCVIFFLGGAVLGQFPHICYSAFLEGVAAKMNASVIAIPYEVGLDHFAIAQGAVSRMKSAVIECEDSRGYPADLPKCTSQYYK